MRSVGSAGTQYNSEAAAERRKAEEAEALLESDPCNDKYREALLKKVEAPNAKQEDTRLGRDGNAPGDWAFVENHPVLPKSAGANVLAPTDGSELVDEVQITDEQGYKLFGPFLYGRFVALSPSGRMELGTDGGGTRSNIASGSDAGGSGGSDDPTAILRYMIDPSVGAITMKLGSRIGQTGAGTDGEAFTATRMASEDASQPKGKGLAGLPAGKVSVDDINNCEKGSVAEKKGADTKESEAAYAQLRKCMGQGDGAETLEPAMVSEEDSKERIWEMSPSEFEAWVSKKNFIERAALRKAYNHRAGDAAYQKAYEDKMSDRSKERLAVLRERRELTQKQRQSGLTESESERLSDLEAERRSWSGANAKARFEGRL